MTIVRQALEFATKAHAGQRRKYTGEPYTVHPRAVATLLRQYGLRAEVVAAGWLHDVVEDCGVSVEQIALEFGDTVAGLVWQVTDLSRPHHGKRAVRKAMDCAHLARATPEGKCIKLADLVDNTSSIVRYDPKFAKVYLAEVMVLLEVLKGCSVPELWIHACDVIHRARVTLAAARIKGT